MQTSIRKYDTIVLGLLKKEEERRMPNRDFFNFTRCVGKIALSSDFIHSFKVASSAKRSRQGERTCFRHCHSEGDNLRGESTMFMSYLHHMIAVLLTTRRFSLFVALEASSCSSHPARDADSSCAAKLFCVHSMFSMYGAL